MAVIRFYNNAKIISLFYALLLGVHYSTPLTEITINANKTKADRFEHFWTSTGFCPPDPKEDIPDFMSRDDEKVKMALIGSLPNKGITHVRIHWLLNLLRSSATANDVSSYNFTHLDNYLSLLNYYGLYPGFEFMGSPNEFINIEKSESFWASIVAETVKRYIDKFGADIVSKWRFETWNEPDLKNYNVMKFTTSEYLNYVNGCLRGLKTAFSGAATNWQLGGPAGLFRDKGHPLCWKVLEICNGAVTQGNSGCPVQFISFHKKGDGTAGRVLNGTIQLLDLIHNKFPNLSDMAIANDEADIETNWSKSLEWRGDARYASMVVKVIADYYKSVRVGRKLKIEVLSNDNAFLNYHPFYFTQRTLFARFQINTTSPRHDQFIKKPVYSVMALLSFLGDEYIEEEATESDPLLTTIATRYKHEKRSFVSVILAYGNDSYADMENSRVVKVSVKNLWEGEWKFLIYQLDNINTNPYGVWRNMNSPVFPTSIQRSDMRAVEEPKRLTGPTKLNNPYLDANLILTLPSIHLIQICRKDEKEPERVFSVAVFNVTRNEVLITWKYANDFTRCLLTYEVEMQSDCSTDAEFKRINPNDTIFLSFHHVGKGDGACEWTRGKYKVRAMDYWNRSGTYSESISYP